MRYPGGKGKCYQHLINLMPPHDTYIESHLGGGAVLRHKAPAKRNIGIDIDPKVIARWNSEYPEYCELIQGNAVHFLNEFNYTGRVLVYADPPYLASVRRREKVYRVDYVVAQHEELLKVLNSLPCMVMISGYDSDLYNSFLSDWRKVTFSAKTHVDVRQECVWVNFDSPNELHDPRFVGSGFRERQTIQRRRSRLFSRIEQMDAVERNALIQWLNKKYGNVVEAN